MTEVLSKTKAKNTIYHRDIYWLQKCIKIQVIKYTCFVQWLNNMEHYYNRQKNMRQHETRRALIKKIKLVHFKCMQDHCT